MKFYLANESESEQFEKIKLWIRKHMDGSVSSKMKENGLNYPINYGVSIVNLRQYANQLELTPSLVLRLWNANIRECMILATFLFNPDLSAEEIRQLSDRITNIELAEQFAFNFGYKINQATVVFQDWLVNPQEFIQVAGMLSVAIALQRGVNVDEIPLMELYKTATNVKLHSFSLQRAITRLLVNILKVPTFRNEITTLVDAWSISDNEHNKAVAREILIELEYSK